MTSAFEKENLNGWDIRRIIEGNKLLRQAVDAKLRLEVLETQLQTIVAHMPDREIIEVEERQNIELPVLE